MKHVCAMLVVMSISITPEPARQAELIELMEAGAAYAQSLYPPEENFLLDVEELEVPGIVVYVARNDSGRALGMVALVPLTDAASGTGTPGEVEAEVKRMFVHPDGRGQGIATTLMDRLEADAAASGFTRIVLETGTLHNAAQALYTRCGYVEIPQYGPYVGAASSLCMAKPLRPAA